MNDDLKKGLNLVLGNFLLYALICGIAYLFL